MKSTADKSVAFYNSWPPHGSSNCLKWFENWNLRLSLTQHTVHILPQLITRFFNHLKILHRHKYTSDEKVKDEEHIWLFMQKEQILVDRTMKILDQSNKCAEMLWDYFENWKCICCCVLIAGLSNNKLSLLLIFPQSFCYF
jgi:hypothetical protein